jgi:carboxypeptidase T
VSVEMALGLAMYLTREYKAGNQRVVTLLNSRTVYIAPEINPDGSEYDIATGDYKLWRKNRRNNGSNYGVDLNRNYGFGWGGGGSSGSTNSDIYRGPSAFSEPETQNVKAFFESHENITINLSFHTFSKLILYPWGHKYENIENAQDFAVHKTMAETMARWNGYTPQQSSGLYIASGDTSDWAYGQMKRISFTFELDPGMDENRWDPGSGFYPGQALIDPVIKKNIEPALYLIEYSDNPYRVLQPNAVNYGLNSPLVD